MIYRTNDIKNAHICVFRKDELSDPVNYTPDEIMIYRFIDDKFFVSKEVTTNNVTEKLFVEYLINGIVNVYSCTYPDGNTRFFVEKDGSEKLIELSNGDREFYDNGIKYLKKINKYTGTLKVMMEDAPSLSKEIDNTSLDRKSLIKLSEDYHNLVCSNSRCIIYEKKLPQSWIELGPTAGYIYTDISEKVVPIGSILVFNDKFKPAFNPAGGVYIKLLCPQSDPKFFIKDELLFMQRTVRSTYMLLYYSDWTRRYFTIKSTELINSLSLGTYLTKRKVKSTVNFGGFVRFPISTDNIGFGEYHISMGQNYPLNNTRSFGVNAGTGVTVKLKSGKCIDILAQYSRGFNIFSHFDFNEYAIKISFPVIN